VIPEEIRSARQRHAERLTHAQLQVFQIDREPVGLPVLHLASLCQSFETQRLEISRDREVVFAAVRAAQKGSESTLGVFRVFVVDGLRPKAALWLGG
jgi:hypothetical protein